MYFLTLLVPKIDEGSVVLGPPCPRCNSAVKVAPNRIAVFASPTRQRIMLLFARGAELSVGEIAELAGIGHSTASQQLAILRRGGIVTSRREGKTVFYRATVRGPRPR
jgi:DNA-binding transcriptional ArsR family regulator